MSNVNNLAHLQIALPVERGVERFSSSSQLVGFHLNKDQNTERFLAETVSGSKKRKKSPNIIFFLKFFINF